MSIKILLVNDQELVRTGFPHVLDSAGPTCPWSARPGTG